ncbi:MAG: YHS domain-containing protein [Acidobacteriota bacterium]
MRKSIVALFLISVFSLAAFAALTDDKKEETMAVTNKECPVSGGKVNPQYRTEYNGQYVYVCCQGCLDEFKKDPEKFVAKMSKEDKEAIKTNALCPISKEAITSKEFWVEDHGRKVYLCCAGCKATYEKKMATKKSD